MLRRSVLFIVLALAALGGAAYVSLTTVAPAQSLQLQKWRAEGQTGDAGDALFAFGDFGTLDLDTLETSAVPWPVLAAALAIDAADGRADAVSLQNVRKSLQSFGFLYPERIAGEPHLKPLNDVPLGLSLGIIERSWPPIRITAINIGCAACHAGPAYRQDGTPDPATAVLGRPNSALNLEAFTSAGYRALKRAFQDEKALLDAMQRLFPEMSLRERLTLKFVALPKARERIAAIASSYDRAMPFANGAPGLTNGVAALKHQLGLTPRDRFNDGAGFVSIPDLSDRGFRSALLADGAYTVKGTERFRPIAAEEAAARQPSAMAGIASFFMVPSMGMTPARAEAAIPDLTKVFAYLAGNRPPRFPGPIDLARASYGRAVYAKSCASCHGSYDDSLEAPRLMHFPNWAGDVGTDTSRVRAFDQKLSDAVQNTTHGGRHMDVASTGKTAAPLLTGVWSSAPYFVNGSVPTLRHLLESETRPVRFMTGGHRISLENVGVDGTRTSGGDWVFPEGYAPYAAPVLIDTTKPGFSNRGHEAEVSGLTAGERDALIEYLKLL